MFMECYLCGFFFKARINSGLIHKILQNIFISECQSSKFCKILFTSGENAKQRTAGVLKYATYKSEYFHLTL